MNNKIVKVGKIESILQRLFALDREKVYEISIKEYKPKRSLNANNYYWRLVNQIAAVMKMSNDDVHFQMLRDYGTFEMFTALNEVDVSKYFKYYEVEKKSEKWTAYRVYMGSSKMNTGEMARLIDGVVQEAQALGIETMTPGELALLKDEWQ